MQMASISRWTLAFFGCALAALVVALALMAGGFGYPNEALLAPKTLFVVHLVAVGWLSLLMLGALLQFLPVLVGRELAWSRLAPLALVAILFGLLLLLAGFAALAGWENADAELLPLGGLVIMAGFALAAAILFATLLRAKTLPLPAGFVAVALLSALLAMLLGDTLAAALAGMIGGDFSVALVTHGVALHAGFGLGGWLTFAAMGVSYRLVSMFLIAPERQGLLPRIAFWGGVAALGGLGLALLLLLAWNAPPGWAGQVALSAMLVAVAAYGGDVVALYRSRRRRELELHMGAAIAAFVMLGLGALLLAGAVLAESETGVAAAIYLLALGWLSGLGLAMLYKIVAFLTWLECFAPVMGRLPTPRVQDLVREERARLLFGLYFLGVLIGTGAILAGMPGLVQAAALMQLAAVLALTHQFYRARRLADLPAQWRHHSRPRLFLPAARQRSLP